ncbi:8-oxo-dGTP diphosphatase [Anaerococcus octavius]|uniref:8-oxo-dGTP diphosphatase YtkD n=1 Tax=Anaerococcus octavius TaxID=54007 RepID=A0A380WS90_9FIRM|nr:NUDIX domain-containing protein [Anaerococcus octavius]SUU91759.1 Putative 8-oxo-dGTP diphosphatase YtkD [Anaerococcus octavius]
MKTRLMNMIKIKNPSTNKVVILDKVKKEGWEGLTFPGGKVEINESLEAAAIREAKEETGLDIKNLKFIGFITWLGKEYKDLGLLYETSDYTGKLIPENREGHLAWIDYEEFKKMDGMSLSMDKILKIYEGEYREIFWNINTEEISYIK